MKIKSEVLLCNNDDVLYDKILITGSDEALISYVKTYFIKKFKDKKHFIDTSGNYNKGITGSLFSSKKVLFLLKEYSSKDKELNESSLINQSVLIASLNNKKNNIIKSEFSKSNNNLVVECYPLNKSGKELTLRKYVKSKNIKLSNDIFWYIVENFDNNYVLFFQQLNTLNLLGNFDSINIIEKAVFIDNKIDLNKIFFKIFNNNKYLINSFNKSIYSQTDFYIFLNSIKLYFDIIASSNNKEIILSKFPKYLFGEKDIFIKIYNQLDNKKILKIYKNIFKIENLIRKNPNLYSICGLRFLLNIKKIIIS